MITLNQAERLVRKIAEVLGQPAQENQAAKLAQEFAEVGRAASRRLEQCALMIEAGEESQALQLAETPPPLLDLITLLSFRQSGEWRTYCQAHSLPWVEPFFDKYVRQLNTTYGKGIAEDHAFYRDYRRAVIQNDDERALSILRVIVRMNPTDQNTAQELQRLEAKTVRARLEGLRQTVESGDPEAILAHLKKLEASALVIPPNHPVLQKAQLIRCQRVLGQAEPLRPQELWQEAEPLVEEIKALAAQHSVLFPEADVARFDALDEWVSGERAAFAQNQDFHRAIEGLEFQVQTSETRRASGGSLRLDQLQTEFNILAGKWREAERFGRPIDPDLLNRCQRNCDWFQAQIQNRIQRKRAKVALASFLVLGLLGLAGFVCWDLWQAKQFVSRLGRLEAGRRVGETQSLLAEIPDRLKHKPRLAEARTRAEQFVSREITQKDLFDEKLQPLQALTRNGFSNGFAVVELRRPECAQALPRLAPEFQSSGQSNLTAFDEKWQAHLRSMQPAVNATFSGRLAELQKFAAGRLNPTNGFEVVRAAVDEAQRPLAELVKLASQPVSLDESSVQRFQQLTNQMSECARNVAQWADLLGRLPHTQSLEDYLKGIEQVSQSPFASRAERRCTEQLRRVNPTELALMGGLLLSRSADLTIPTDAVLTNLTAATFSLRPAESTEAEKIAYSKLLDDVNFQEIYLYSLTNNPRNLENRGNHKVILTRGILGTNRLNKLFGMIHDFQASPDLLKFQPATIDDWDWDYRRVEKGLYKDSEAFTRLGMNDLIDRNTGNYQQSIIELLDRLSQDTRSSAVFRAFLSLRLFEIAELRPASWGLHWAPSTAVHIQKLKGKGAANLRSGDWLVRSQLALYEEPLKQYFDQVRSRSLEKEARFYYKLTSAANEAKFAFAGYVDARGSVVLTRSTASSPPASDQPSQFSGDGTGELWGWSAHSRLPVLLFGNSGQSVGEHPVSAKLDEPVCYTPLFVFLGDRRTILEKASGTADYSMDSETNLPLLFSHLPPRGGGQTVGGVKAEHHL